MKRLLPTILILLTACSEKTYEPEIKLKLIDKITNKPITQALNSLNISIEQDGSMNISKKTRTQIIAPFDGMGPHYISTLIGISPKGYKPQWCLCNTLNYKESCISRVVKFTPKKESQITSQEDLIRWMKKEDKYIAEIYKLYKGYDLSKQTPAFCSEDRIKLIKGYSTFKDY